MQSHNPAVRWLSSRQADLAWKLMAAIALVISVIVGVRQYQMTACQARFNEASNRAWQARSEAAETDRQAVDDVMRAVAANPREGLDAVRAYNARRAEANLQRAANPVPPPPSETCG